MTDKEVHLQSETQAEQQQQQQPSANLSLDGMAVDPDFLAHCAHQAEKLLFSYANDPANSPLVRQMVGVYLQRHGMLLGMLSGVVELHNAACDIAKDKVTGDAADVSSVMDNLALLANACVNQFGRELSAFRMEFDTAAGQIKLINVLAERQAQEAAELAQAQREAQAQKGAEDAGFALEPSGDVDPLLAAHDKGLH